MFDNLLQNHCFYNVFLLFDARPEASICIDASGSWRKEKLIFNWCIGRKTCVEKLSRTCWIQKCYGFFYLYVVFKWTLEKTNKNDWNLIANLWKTNKKQLKFDIGRVSDAANPNKIDSNRVCFIVIVGIGWIPDAGNPWTIDQNQ